ncbi:YfzA family protein [Gracilibacillus sp. S3-1-1]|uniref:YfzA family protein n=1 Tax=Gracilibacillus pellucidus TaxID=3095368 RepID=A0ACC6M6S8_9BACI|nr:YfzA family protein [Gracilibacillus sp. S3-1-1]MDX8046522.1 YfzA family protein [Gracilibacillus sp. S3-1-1]
MVRTEKVEKANLPMRWLIILGIFVVVQLIFMVVDGTSLEPNINDSGNLGARIARWVLESKLFTEWITPYSFPFFNLCITIHVIAILIQVIEDIFSRTFSKK